jgi:hypothetical protein
LLGVMEQRAGWSWLWGVVSESMGQGSVVVMVIEWWWSLGDMVMGM